MPKSGYKSQKNLVIAVDLRVIAVFSKKKKNIWLSLIDEVLKLIANDFRETISAPETFFLIRKTGYQF